MKMCPKCWRKHAEGIACITYDTCGVGISSEPVDMVNKPKHYTEHPSGVECITIAQYFNFNIGNVIKYVWRAGLKGGQTKRLEDLKKARWYIDKEIERVENEEKETT